MTDELKPCPFCGGEAETEHCGVGMFSHWVVYCVNCNATIEDINSREEAIAAWNTRAERTTELIVAADDLGKDLYPCMCFQCGYTKLDDFWRKNHVNYCPNCGAKVADSATSGYLVADKPTDSETVTTCATTGEQRFGPGWPDTWLIAK